MEESSSSPILANTTQVLSQNLLLKSSDKNIVTYTSYDREQTTFFGSFAEPLCFLGLIMVIFIIIYGLKYVHGDSQEAPRLSWLPSTKSTDSTKYLAESEV